MTTCNRAVTQFGAEGPFRAVSTRSVECKYLQSQGGACVATYYITVKKPEPDSLLNPQSLVGFQRLAPVMAIQFFLVKALCPPGVGALVWESRSLC